MSRLTICKFTPEDIPQIMLLQRAYQQVYPSATIIPGEVYLSPGFENGNNIICAFDENHALQGYAPLYPNLPSESQTPATVWAEVKAHPGLSTPQEVKDPLFERVVNRTKEIIGRTPRHKTRLTFQYHPTETRSIEYVISKGCAYTESVFRMMCPLARDFPRVSPPEQITVKRWRMETKEEQQTYIQARNEAFPETPVAIEDWENFLASPAWQDGITITAFDREEIVGSVAVYWDEAIVQMTGKKAGYTEYIFVREKWRKRGIASYLVNQGLRYLKEHGREAAFLEVRANNQQALELYVKSGYKVIDESRLYVLEI
jgi:ribosomal protein S18 acetylase RimI-like enzyme